MAPSLPSSKLTPEGSKQLQRPSPAKRADVTPAALENTHLGGHDQLVIHDVVRGVAHSKEGAGRVQVAGHACPDVHILPDSLGKRPNKWLPQQNTARLGSSPTPQCSPNTSFPGKPRSAGLYSEKGGLCAQAVSGQEGVTAPPGSSGLTLSLAAWWK